MNVAVFGAGRIGKIHSGNVARQPGVCLKYIVDVFPEAASELAKTHGAQTAVTIRTRRGRLCQINTSRRAAYGYDQRFEVLGSEGMLQAGNIRPTQVTAYSAKAVSTDVPEPFFLERYRAAYAAEMAHFFEVLTKGGTVRTSVDDGVKALELAEAATQSMA